MRNVVAKNSQQFQALGCALLDLNIMIKPQSRTVAAAAVAWKTFNWPIADSVLDPRVLRHKTQCHFNRRHYSQSPLYTYSAVFASKSNCEFYNSSKSKGIRQQRFYSSIWAGIYLQHESRLFSYVTRYTILSTGQWVRDCSLEYLIVVSSGV